VNMNPGPGPWGTPDYFHPCGSGGTAPPATFSGTCAVQNGQAMMGLVLYNSPYPEYREYLSCHLNCTMTPATIYTVSLWLSNGTGIKSPYTIRNIGVHFSATPLSQSGWNLISVVPQCEITSNVVSSGWTQYTFTVNPTANWSYMTIGAFRPDANNNPTQSFPNPGGPASAYANYFLDNIQVLAPSTGSMNLNVSSSNTLASICAGSSVTLTANGASSYSWSNNSSGPVIVVSPSITTSYTVTSSYNDACSAYSASAIKTISVSPSPVVTISGLNEVCKGKPLTLTAAGASNYLWSTASTNQTISVTPTITTVYSATGTSNGCSAIKSFTVNVINCLSIQNILGNGVAQIFPNPFKNEIVVQASSAVENLSLEIVNLLGETVYSGSISKPSTRLDVAVLPAGIYFVNLKSADQKISLKMIKE
jgi:hypothetical protein